MVRRRASDTEPRLPFSKADWDSEAVIGLFFFQQMNSYFNMGNGRHEITKVFGGLGLRFAVTPCVDSYVEMNVTTGLK